MNNKKIKYLICSLILVVLIYTTCLLFFGEHDNTKINNPINDVLINKPRLQDDYYNNVNYDYLSVNQLEEDNDSWYYMYSKSSEMIEKEKKEIIDNILKNCDKHQFLSPEDKICIFYQSYKKNSEESQMKKEIDYYIKLINDTQNINDYVSTILKINQELSIGALVNPTINFMPSNLKQPYFTLNNIQYDYDIEESEYYSLNYYEQELNILKKYNVEILKEYGYKDNEAYKMANNIQSMYKEVARFSIKSDKLLDKGYKLYTIDELQKELKVLNLSLITEEYNDIYNYGDKILVTDINQLKAIDSYLTNSNLSTLKEYSIMRILTEYSKYINNDFYKIYNKLEESMYDVSEEFDSKEELIYNEIYSLFQDTIVSEFSKKNFTEEEKNFYTNLVNEEIEIFKTRIKTKEWITDKTKTKALEKMEKLDYTIGIPGKFVYAENNYIISKNKTYFNNIISIKKALQKEYNTQYKNGNIMYGAIDYLEQNAYYEPNSNRINVLLGIIYSIKVTLNLDVNDLNSSYYELLGSIGATIGHELSHSLDSSGSKYDGEGNYINWWTDKDLDNFNKLNIKVVKYYNMYNQFGDTTLGENIADLGGMEIIMDIAKNKNASNNDYKTIFESYALDWCSQSTPYYKVAQLYYDEHSPDKNRVNAVLSSTDEFYKIYDIIETDDMYVSDKDRVSIW